MFIWRKESYLQLTVIFDDRQPLLQNLYALPLSERQSNNLKQAKVYTAMAMKYVDSRNQVILYGIYLTFGLCCPFIVHSSIQNSSGELFEMSMTTYDELVSFFVTNWFCKWKHI